MKRKMGMAKLIKIKKKKKTKMNEINRLQSQSLTTCRYDLQTHS